MSDYEIAKNAFAQKLRARKFVKSPEPRKMTYAQIAANIPREHREIYNRICHCILWLTDFKDIVFEILEAYDFRECSTFVDLLTKWKIDKTSNVPILSSFFSRTEPAINKLPFYRGAFEYLSSANLAEFLAESISNGELEPEFVITLENSI